MKMSHSKEDLNSLIFEVERLTGERLIPVDIDYRIYGTPIGVLLLLLLIRPSFLYREEKFKVYLLLWYTFLISAIIVGCVYAYAYRRFF